MYAAEWFGGCLMADNITPIENCSPDFTSYAYWSTMFFSIAGFITFVVSSSVGYLSDRHGRKIFFLMAIVTWAIPRITMIFYINFYLYFGLSLFTALNGGDFFVASKGYLADIIHDKDERVVAFGFGQSAVGLGCILGSILAVSVSIPFDDHAVFVALGGWYILLLLFVMVFIKEPARFTTGEAPVHNTNHSANPFKYLGKVCHYNLIFYLSLLSLLMAWAESGIMTSLFAYIGNEFGLERQGESSLVYAIFAFLMAVAVVLAGFMLLPMKRLYDELWIMIIAVSIKIASFTLLALISMYPAIFNNYGVLYFSSILYGTSFLIWPTISGLLGKHMGEEEQATGFGILDAWTSIASIVAPFSFGQLYVYSIGHGMQWLLFGVAILFCIVSIIIIAYPLKAAVKKQRSQMSLLKSFRVDSSEDLYDTVGDIGNTTVVPIVAPLVNDFSIYSYQQIAVIGPEFTPTPALPSQQTIDTGQNKRVAL